VAQRDLRAYFARAAEEEFVASRGRYAREAREIARFFEAEVRRAVAFIERFPEASPIAEGTVRRKVLRKPFEYSLFYVVEPDRIRILAVAHHRRDPVYWTGR
jgi:plasmid stabilization system protein ParE